VAWFNWPTRLKRAFRSQRFAILEACLIGVVAALAAVLLKDLISWLGGLRIQAATLLPALWVLPGIGLVGGLLSGLLVETLAPEAVGSGIPRVKAALSYQPIALNLRVAGVKLISTSLALASGLALGRQGPTVHLGAALASQLSRWLPVSPTYRRQLIAAGAAAGLAAGFNTPIAGVMFVVEELLKDVSDLTLGVAILSSFIGAVISRLLGGAGLSLDLETGVSRTTLSLHEIPLFLLLGLLAGFLGVVFNRCVLASLNLNRSLRLALPWRVGMAGLLSGLLIAVLPTTLRDNAGLQDLLTSGNADWELVLLAFSTKLLLTLLAYGAGTPGGLFAPVLTIGAALGSLVSYGVVDLQTFMGIAPGEGLVIGSYTTYALAGAGALFSAVARGPVTAIIIIFERTLDFNLVLPLMVAAVTAYLIARAFDPNSIYDHLLAWNGIHLEQDPAKEGRLSELRAANIMQRRVETLSHLMPIAEVRQAFSRSHHRGFPVVEAGRLTGIVTQTDLDRVRRFLPDRPLILADIMTPDPVTASPDDSLGHVLYLLNRYKISRLPVTEGRHLVGIITRADIIRAESDQLAGTTPSQGKPHAPGYVVYQTREPATGRGRLLVPLSNPHTAPVLLKLAITLARAQNYEVECTQAIVVPEDRPPTETSVNISRSRNLMRQAVRLGKAWQVPVHTRIVVTHDVAQAVLETITERYIDLTLMGWKGNTATAGRVFGRAVDTVIRQADCDVVLVKLGQKLAQLSTQPIGEDHWETSIQFNRWLVPIGGGPNVQQAIQLLPALLSLGRTPEIFLCQVGQPAKPLPDKVAVEKAVAFLQDTTKATIHTRLINSSSVSEAIVEQADRNECDVIMIGASREGLLQQVVKGNIPAEIARDSNCTVLLVRRSLA